MSKDKKSATDKERERERSITEVVMDDGRYFVQLELAINKYFGWQLK
jgi:hypothetical protein